MSLLSTRCPSGVIALALLASLASGAAAQSLPDAPAPAQGESDPAQTIADLQRQIDELKAMVMALQSAQSAQASQTAAPAAPPTSPALATTATPAPALAAVPAPTPASDPGLVSAAAPARKDKAW